MLIGAAALALVVANSSLEPAYRGALHSDVGPLSVTHWINDGLMSVFFLLVGLEIKREALAGELASWNRRVLPGVSAVGGMVVPALIFLAFNGGDTATARGWAIPSATDIAFALGLLALVGDRVPPSLKIFLTALAIIDDLGAIIIIALFYTNDLSVLHLALAGVVLAALIALNRLRVVRLLPYLCLGAVLWVLVLQSGVHATVAGVLLAFTVPVVRSRAAGGPDAGPGLAEHFEHRFRPISAGIAVPVFAFFSAGVAVGGLSGLTESVTDSVAVGITVGLVLGKTIGITGATWLVSRFTRAQLDENLGWPDVIGLSLLGGIGFTVSLLITELAFGLGTETYDHAKVGILTGTLLAALLATVVLRLRNRRYKRIYEDERADFDLDGIPDVYQRETVDDRADHRRDRDGGPPPGRTAGGSAEG